MSIHSFDIFFVRAQPSLWVKLICVLAKYWSIAMNYWRTHPYDCARLEMHPGNLKTLFRDNPLQWIRHTGMATHGFFDYSLSVKKKAKWFSDNHGPIVNLAVEILQVRQLQWFCVSDLLGEYPGFVRFINLPLSFQITLRVLYEVINNRPEWNSSRVTTGKLFARQGVVF